MSGDTLDAVLLADELLKEFIFSANGCLEGGKFKPDERYKAAIYDLSLLPEDTLRECADALQIIGEHYPKMSKFYELFRSEFD